MSTAVIIDRIETLSEGQVQVRCVREDGRFHREVLEPGDTARADELGGDVKTTADTLWTQEVVTAWEGRFK